MASDTEDAKKAASLVQEATRNYEKASEEFGAARQDSSEAQELQEHTSRVFFSLPSSHPATGAQVWSYRFSSGLAGPLSLAELYGMAHGAASGVTLDTLICCGNHGTSLLLREAVAQHPVIQQRFQSMASAIAAASAAARVEKERRVARQIAAYKLHQPQALLAWLSMGDEVWIQCSAEPRVLSVKQIQELVLKHSLSARLEFRAPRNGQTTQVADLIVLEYETLAARHLCSSQLGSLAERDGCQEVASLPEPGDLKCWQRVDSNAAPKVLHSSKAIVQLFQAGKWDIQQRLSHCSCLEESMSFAAVHAACDRLKRQTRDLLRDPVVVPGSKVRAAQAELEERLARQVKQQLRDFVRVRFDQAEQKALQRTAHARDVLLAQGAKPAEGSVVKGSSGKSVPKQLSPKSPRGKTAVADCSTSAPTHLNGHTRTDLRDSTEQASEGPEPAAAEESKAVHAHANGHSTAQQARFCADSEHTASQNGALHPRTATPADAEAQTQTDASLAQEKERAASRDPAIAGSRSRCRQRLVDEELECSRLPCRWKLTKQAGSSVREVPQPGQAHVCDHRCLHAHELRHDQEQRCTRKHPHEHSEQLSQTHRHRDRRRHGSGDDHRSRSRSSVRSRSASEAREPSRDPDQARQGAEPFCEVKRTDSVQLAEVAPLAPEQAMNAAQLPNADLPMAGTPHTAESLTHNSSLQADPVQRTCPPMGTASKAGSAGEIRVLLASRFSAAEHGFSAPPAATLAADAPGGSAASEAGHSRAASPALEAGPAGTAPSDAAGVQEAFSAQPAAASPAEPRAASPNSAGDGDADAIMVPTPDQGDAGRAASRLMLAGYGTGLEWDPDSLDAIPDEPMLLLDVPSGPRIFAAGMTRSEFLEQREEIGRIWKRQAPDGDDFSSTEHHMDFPTSQAGQDTCKQVVIINGRTGAVTHHNIPPPQHRPAPGQHEPESRRGEPQARVSSEDELPLPEKPMSRRAARELGDLIEGLPGMATLNRQRRVPVPFKADWQSSKPPPCKKRKHSETPEREVLLPCHTAAPVKAARAPGAAPKHPSKGAVKTSKGALAGAAPVQEQDEPREEDDKDWKFSNRQARELEDLMSGQQWDCSLPRGRRPAGPDLPAALPGCYAPPSKVKGSAAQRDSTAKVLTASKAGKAKRRQRDPGKAAEQDGLICSRMLPVDKVSRRSTTTARKARRAVQVEDDAAGTARTVKRRVDRNEEILDWRKLKGKGADLKLTRSKVHAWGLTAVKPIQAEQFVIEYTGELIRLSVNSIRERLDCDSDYRFRVDDQWVVDATTKGGLARFINHCCDPNCYTKIVTVDNAKHILIFSKRAIPAGEELSYDYKFETTPGEAPIPCTCGAKNCQKRLN